MKISTPESIAADKTLTPWVVTCKSNAVWFGYAAEEAIIKAAEGAPLLLRGARNVFYWVASGGIGSLPSSGPSAGSRVGDACDVILTDTHAFSPCTEKAVVAFETAGWAA